MKIHHGFMKIVLSNWKDFCKEIEQYISDCGVSEAVAVLCPLIPNFFIHVSSIPIDCYTSYMHKMLFELHMSLYRG